MTYSTFLKIVRSFSHLKPSLLVASLFILPLVSGTGQAAMQIFMLSEQIQGESKDSTFPGAIDVLAVQWGSSLTTQSGGGAGAASFSDITVTKRVDSSTPDFFLQMSQGGILNDITLIFRRTGENPLDYFAIRLTNVRINSFDISADSDGDDISEQVTMDYGKIEFFYRVTDQDGKGGEIKGSCYDLQANVNC